jgi:uncharacterized protein
MQFSRTVTAFSFLVVCTVSQGEVESLERARLFVRTGDFTAAVQVLDPLAQAGDADAQFELAELAYSGRGLSKNQEFALELLRLASQQGHPKAALQLGVAYWTGRPRVNLDRNTDEAIRLYKIAAMAGLAGAQANLGRIYEGGEGTKLDHASSVYWYTLASAQSHVSAQANLGIKFVRGEGTVRDVAKGLGLLQQASEKGHNLATSNLGLILSDPSAFGLDDAHRDYARAIPLLRKATEQRGNMAAVRLAHMYWLGQGVPTSRVIAEAILSLANAQPPSLLTSNCGDPCRPTTSAERISASELVSEIERTGELWRVLDRAIPR